MTKTSDGVRVVGEVTNDDAILIYRLTLTVPPRAMDGLTVASNGDFLQVTYVGRGGHASITRPSRSMPNILNICPSGKPGRYLEYVRWDDAITTFSDALSEMTIWKDQ